MKRLVPPLLLIALLSPGAALADCPREPDTNAWDGPPRQAAQALCLQHELSQRTDERAWQLRLQSQLDAISRNEITQRQQPPVRSD